MADRLPEQSADKLRRVHAAHVAELNRLVETWRGAPAGARPERTVPWFDPDGGGVGARVLLLMESPGPRTVAAGGAGVCSEDNPDPTARALKAARERSGLQRPDCVKWNVVPWPVLDRHGRPAGPRVSDLDDARPALAQVLELLPRLLVVITFGTAALNGYMRYLTLQPAPTLTPVLAVPHPSLRNTRQRAQAEQRVAASLAIATSLCLHANGGSSAAES